MIGNEKHGNSYLVHISLVYHETSSIKISETRKHKSHVGSDQHTDISRTEDAYVHVLCHNVKYNVHRLINIGFGALTVPMHLGLIDRPYVPHKLISQESTVPLLKFQMALRLTN